MEVEGILYHISSKLEVNNYTHTIHNTFTSWCRDHQILHEKDSTPGNELNACPNLIERLSGHFQKCELYWICPKDFPSLFSLEMHKSPLCFLATLSILKLSQFHHVHRSWLRWGHFTHVHNYIDSHILSYICSASSDGKAQAFNRVSSLSPSAE